MRQEQLLPAFPPWHPKAPNSPWKKAKPLDTGRLVFHYSPEFARFPSQDLAVQPFIMGRPTGFTFHDTEAVGLLREADGIGLSALRDFPRREDAEAWAEAAHKAGKPVALHASEAKRENMEDVLALEPEFLVHCTQATDDDLDAVGDDGVTVVVCPRSNAHYGMKTPLHRLREAGVTVAVGTDNGMLNDGDLLAELSQLHDWFPDVPLEQLLRMATIHGRALVGLGGLPKRKGAAADLVVLPDQPLRRVSGRPGFVIPPASQAKPPAGPAKAPGHGKVSA